MKENGRKEGGKKEGKRAESIPSALVYLSLQ